MSEPIEFERHLAGPATDVRQEAAQSLRRSMMVGRGAALLIGAVAIALLTRAFGLGLGGALCVFVGLLPLLLAGAWVVGFFTMVKATTELVRENAASGGPGVVTLRRQKVRLMLSPEALEVELDDGGQRRTELWPWAEVHFEPGEAVVRLRKGREQLDVPVAAFGTPERFALFTQAVQDLVVAAMPRAVEKT